MDSREQARLEEKSCLSIAYFSLLRLPQGECRARARMQAILAGLRDEIAMLEGRGPEDIQNEFEERVLALQAEGGSLKRPMGFNPGQ